MQTNKNYAANSAIIGIYRLIIIFSVIFTLYFAEEILIPLTVSGLLTFLLSPVVTWLEKWIGRIPSILFSVIAVFFMLIFLIYVFTKQLIQFGANLPQYSENIQTKLDLFQFSEWKIFTKLEQLFDSIQVRILGESSTETLVKVHPIDVKLLDLGSIFASIAEWLSYSLFNVVASIGIVLLFVIFMLLNREDIRSRIVKLFGEKRISSTTSAIDDASERVYNYLYRLLIVNIGFGLSVAGGLYLLGIPNPILWGGLGAILRFIPYIGAWIAAIIPIIISFIVTDTWSIPFLTIAFFIVLELATAYVVEPFYYGHGTGVSSFALVLAAIFWTWLWGPVGLLLSTPLTVCLVVIGQHMANMRFLSVLLSKEEALTPAEECYHRLLSYDSSSSMDVIESYLKKDSLISLYDSVLIPIMTQAEMDYNLDAIDSEKKEGIYQNISEIVDFLNEQKDTTKVNTEPKIKVLCLPVRAKRDEFGANILSELLVKESFYVQKVLKVNISDLLGLIEKINPDIICITAIAPIIFSHIEFLCSKLQHQMPGLPIIIFLGGGVKSYEDNTNKLMTVGATKIVYSLSDAIEAMQDIRSNLDT